MASSVSSAETFGEFFAPASDRLKRKFLNLRMHTNGAGFNPETIVHVGLLPGVSLADILAAGDHVNWESTFDWLDGKIMWLTEDSFVDAYNEELVVHEPGMHSWEWTVDCPHENWEFAEQTLFCTEDDEQIVSEFLLDFAAKSNASKVRLWYDNQDDGDDVFRTRLLPLRGRSLSQLFWAREHIDDFRLGFCCLSIEHWQTLETVSRPDLVLDLSCCDLHQDDEGHRAAAAQCLQASKGPTSLVVTVVTALTPALIGNSRITKIYCHSYVDFDETALFAFGRVLVQMKGLTELRMTTLCPEKLIKLCPMLEGHATLNTFYAFCNLEPSKSQKTELIWALANLVRTTPGLHTIYLDETHRNEQVYMDHAVPHLETNLHRPRVKAVTKIKCDNFRRKVLGRALAAVSGNPNLLWMYLSENADAVFFGAEQEQLGGKRKRE